MMTTAGAAPDERGRSRRAAKLITDVLSPGALLSVLLVVVPVHAVGAWPGLGWGLLAVVFVSVVPLGYIFARVRRRTLTDMHVGVREHRLLPFVVGLVSVVAGLVGLLVGGAPRDLVAVVGVILADAAVLIVVSSFWKISVHAMVAMMTTGILAVVHGRVLWALLPLVALVAWSRVRLTDHTGAQVVAGAAVGLAMVVVFVLFRGF
ncbi:phosphoesterase PA-phosphatase [Couchioplanes caeruleus]|uniref:phosphoesterase PA-phosphatase n=1 Tax=Couchioplanes caeruleus TaxID=56438 RepID=UPI0020BFC428|nr:phosphoesterase PA-phosphatase [Couchioplanes caeruleus]UQU63464.1 phosphoesterase PA-phosphatase [Couchioplanes caeruleus]